jgi:hypothetical protein
VDVTKQLDERDVGYKAEIDQLKGQIAELLDEKEQREGQLKKVQGLLVTSEAEASDTKAELQSLKEQATKWEVDVARLNADLASKLSNSLAFILPDILYPTYSAQHILSDILPNSPAYQSHRHTLTFLISSLLFRSFPCLC